jgi:predicted Zn-dependent protease
MRIAPLVAIVVLLAMLNGCKSNPVTGRKQLLFYPEGEMAGMAAGQYQEVLASEQLVTGGEQAEMIQRVGERIAAAVESYLQQKGHGERLSHFQWEFKLVESPTVNAWCMPGGKVAFYTGILPVCQDETGVAVVMGHEIAHAVAQHGNERMSQQMAVQTGLTAGAVTMGLTNHDPGMQELVLGAVGAGATVGIILPFSRKHESEADQMGLTFMAMAGYDPSAAPAFWQRMKAASGGGSSSDFLSTHPSDEKRIADLNRWLPQAQLLYEEAKPKK